MWGERVLYGNMLGVLRKFLIENVNVECNKYLGFI